MKTEFKQYQRKSISEMRPFIEGEVLDSNVSISEADKNNGSPKMGDMIARNPKNHVDQWLVAEDYFKDNLEPVSPSSSIPEIKDEEILDVAGETYMKESLGVAFMAGAKWYRSELKKREGKEGANG